MYRALTLWAFALFIGYDSISAQQDDIMVSISYQLESMVDTYVKESFLKHKFARDVNDLRFLFGPKAVDSILLNSELEEMTAEMQVIRKDKGIDLQAGYLNNFAGSLFEDDGTFYQSRTTAGLNWDLFKGGLVAQKHQLAQKKIEYEVSLAEQGDKLNDLSYRKSFDLIIFTFNQEKLRIIQNRLDILAGLLEVVEKMYYLRYSHWEDVLDVMSKKAETEIFLNNYVNHLESIQIDSSLRDQKVASLPVFDLLFDAIEARGIDTLTRSLVLEKNLKALEHQFHWSNQVDVSAQLRYNYYNGGINSLYSARDFMAGGISFSVPLPFNQSSRKSWKAAKEKKIRSEYESYQQSLHNELLTHYYEYEYTHKQYVQYFYKKEQLAVGINRSIRQRRLEDPEYSPMAVVDKLDELFSVDLELIDIQQKMYLKALKIFAMINAQDVLPYIDVKDYNQLVRKYDSDRFLFCNAKDLLEYQTNFLIEFFIQNGIREVSVDAGANAETYLNYAALLDAAVGSDLTIRFSIDPLLGESTLVRDLDALTRLSLTPNIHLDLLATLAEAPDDYTEIIATVTNLRKKFNISLSVPIDTESTFLKTLLSLVDHVYLVPENSSHLTKTYPALIASIGSAYVQKISPVIRPLDFETKMEMDHFLDQLVNQWQSELPGINSMDELIRLDKKIVGWHEEHRF